MGKLLSPDLSLQQLSNYKNVAVRQGTNKRTFFAWLGMALLAGGMAGCAGTPPRSPLPVDLIDQAMIPGVPDARSWGDKLSQFLEQRLQAYSDADIQRHFPAIYDTEHNYLAISGGGANGAFGAGLLAGWTERGNRPKFSMVTGISTGALTAPFAFLGSEYDDVLKKIYTTTSSVNIFGKRNLITSLFSDSMVDTAPFREMLKRYIDTDLIEAIARQHRQGRRLFIGTFNLDASRPVNWSIGAIAASDYPRKAELIRDVLQASASIPVVFPPVVIPVQADGISFDEMHVDGGTGAQVFVYPADVNWQQLTRKLKARGTASVYVIRNAVLEPNYQGVHRGILPIGTRTIDSLIRSQGLGDLYQIYTLCKRDGNAFNLAYIPPDFTEVPKETFDPVYMKKLYELGYKMAVGGYPWEPKPPGLRATMGE
jgi:predicted patatin/cPLA2 family phospholipase